MGCRPVNLFGYGGGKREAKPESRAKGGPGGMPPPRILENERVFRGRPALFGAF